MAGQRGGVQGLRRRAARPAGAARAAWAALPACGAAVCDWQLAEAARAGLRTTWRDVPGPAGGRRSWHQGERVAGLHASPRWDAAAASAQIVTQLPAALRAFAACWAAHQACVCPRISIFQVVEPPPGFQVAALQHWVEAQRAAAHPHLLPLTTAAAKVRHTEWTGCWRHSKCKMRRPQQAVCKLCCWYRRLKLCPGPAFYPCTGRPAAASVRADARPLLACCPAAAGAPVAAGMGRQVRLAGQLGLGVRVVPAALQMLALAFSKPRTVVQAPCCTHSPPLASVHTARPPPIPFAVPAGMQGPGGGIGSDGGSVLPA